MTKRVNLRLGVIKGIKPSKTELVPLSLLRVCEPSPSQVLSTASLCELENKKLSVFLISEMNVENSMTKIDKSRLWLQLPLTAHPFFRCLRKTSVSLHGICKPCNSLAEGGQSSSRSYPAPNEVPYFVLLTKYY